MPGPDRSNIFVSKDAWVAPILAKTGPDGAVWVLDWYNYLFLHNPATPGGNCQDGIPNNGCAWNNDLRKKERVRIYRVTPADGKTEPILDLSNATIPELVGTFANPNLMWRLAAQRLLIGKGYSAELGAQLENILVNSRMRDSVQNDPLVVHALWTLHGLGQFSTNTDKWNPILANLLKHPAWGVRRNVLRAMTRTAATATAISTNCSVNDSHGHVRLQALIALDDINPSSKPAMYDAYRNADGNTGTAATLAQAAGVGSSASLLCEPTLDPVSNLVVGVEGNPGLRQPRNDLRFALLSDGFRLLPHGQLPSGEITVSGLNGRVVFRSRYNSQDGRWVQSEMHGLKQPIYLYRFVGNEGTVFQGRLSFAAAKAL